MTATIPPAASGAHGRPAAGQSLMDGRQCTATSKRSGERCKNRPPRGARTCRFHGSANARSVAAAARRVAEASALQAIRADSEAVLSYAASMPIDDPLDVLARLASEAAAWKDALGARVNALTAIRFESDTGSEQLRAEVVLYERAIDRMARLLEVLVKLDFEGRRVRMSEAQGALVAEVIRAVLADLGLTAEQRERVPEVVPRHLRLLAGGGQP